MALPEYPFIDVQDYLALDEKASSVRYEYVDGRLRMLAGGSLIIRSLRPISQASSTVRSEKHPVRCITPIFVLSSQSLAMFIQT